MDINQATMWQAPRPRTSPLMAWQICQAFIRELAQLAQRSPASAEWTREHAKGEISVFVKALELPPRERFRAEQLLEAAYELAVQGNHLWQVAAEHAVPTDTSVRFVLRASTPRVRGRGRAPKASRTPGKRGRS